MLRQPASIHADNDSTDALDTTRRFVRVTGISPRGFVEFEFSVGVPELCVELMLPREAFEEFCMAQNAVQLAAEGETMTSRSKQ